MRTIKHGLQANYNSIKYVILLLISTSLYFNLYSQTMGTIISPNGGESFEPGTTINIDYECVDGEAYDDLIFYYSTDNGVSFNWIGDYLFTTTPPSFYFNFFSWDIPLGINSTDCLIKMEVYRTPGGVGVVHEVVSNSVFTIAETTSLVEDGLAGLSIYPNPTKNRINIESSYGITSVRVINSIGKLVFEVNQIQPITEINLEHFANGLYSVQMSNSEAHWNKTIQIQR